MIFTFVALLKAASVPGTLRLFLINLLLAGLLLALVLMIALCTSIVLISVSSNVPRPRYLCRVYLWVFGIGTVTRLWSLAASSLSIVAIVRFGKKTIGTLTATGIVFALWLVPSVVCLFVFIPYVYEAAFFDGVACYPDLSHTSIPAGQFSFISVWTIFGGISPLIVSIIVPIVCFCYIYGNTVTEGAQYRKEMSLFSVFLMVGDVINITGQIIPEILGLSSETAAGVYVSYSFVAISLIPTPIVIMIFLKPVRKMTVYMLTCGRVFTTIKTPEKSSTDDNL